jgi:hypothetical protein
MIRIKTYHLVLMMGLVTPIPSYAANYCIRVICPAESTGCPTGVGIDTEVGFFGGPAAKTSCTTALLNLPAVPD